MNQQQFDNQFTEFCQQSIADGRFTPTSQDQHPILNDDADQTIHISWDYWIHTAWAAREIKKFAPRHGHIDFGSYVYFAGICSAFVPYFHFADIRPIAFPLPDLTCVRQDMTKIEYVDNCWESVSCLHVLEHVGLGRYGDTLDATADRKAASASRASSLPAEDSFSSCP